MRHAPSLFALPLALTLAIAHPLPARAYEAAADADTMHEMLETTTKQTAATDEGAPSGESPDRFDVPEADDAGPTPVAEDPDPSMSGDPSPSATADGDGTDEGDDSQNGTPLATDNGPEEQPANQDDTDTSPGPPAQDDGLAPEMPADGMPGPGLQESPAQDESADTSDRDALEQQPTSDASEQTLAPSAGDASSTAEDSEDSVPSAIEVNEESAPPATEAFEPAAIAGNPSPTPNGTGPEPTRIASHVATPKESATSKKPITPTKPVTPTKSTKPQKATAQSQKPIKATVTISVAKWPKKRVGITGSSKKAGAAAQLQDSNSSTVQRFRISPVKGTNLHVITNVNSGKALTVKGNKASLHAAVVQATYAGSLGQKWIISLIKGNIYTIRTALASSSATPLYLGFDAKTGRLQILSGKESWLLENTKTVAEGVYLVSSHVASNRTLDVAGASLDKGANIQSHAINRTNAQRYAFSYDERTGYYTVTNVASGMVLDVAGASSSKGANVRLWKANGTAAQQWSVERAANGLFTLVNRASGLVLDVSGGSTANNANVVQWRRNGTKAQQWKLTKTAPLANGCYTIAAFAARNLVVDVRGGSLAPYANVQIHKANGTVAQRFEILQYASGLYTIRNLATGLYVGVRGSSRNPKANVDIEGGVTIDKGRLWRARPGVGGITFESATGLALDIAYGRLASDNNVWAYRPNGTQSQHFVLAPASGKALGITQLAATIPTDSKGVAPRSYSRRIDGLTYLFLPSCVDLSKLSLSYLTTREGARAQVATSEKGAYRTLGQGGRIDLTSGFKRDGQGAYVVWIKTDRASDARPVRVMASSGLRTAFLASDDPVGHGRTWIEASATHANKTSGSFVLLTSKGHVVYDGDLTQIKGRGNSTWTMPKRPYQIKLAKKASLLDGSKGNQSKTWVLLANYLDTTMEHDHLSKKLALELGLANTPDSEYVDLFYDGEYRGTYQLGERVEVGTGRVDIHDLEEDLEDLNGDTSAHGVAQGRNSFGQSFQYVKGIKDPADITGGYLLEMDNGNYKGERSWFATTAGYFVIKSPEDASYAQVKYISERMQRAVNEAGKEGGDLSRYLNVESLAKSTLVNEVAKNPDYLVWSSTYYYKDRGADAKINAGPVWDLDLAYGVARQDENKKYSLMAPEDFMHQTYGYYGNNRQFRTAFKKAYTDHAGKVKALVSGGSTGRGKVGDTAALLSRSWQMNRRIWPYQPTVYVPLALSDRSDANEHLWNWTAARVNWLDHYFTGRTKPVVSLDNALSGTYRITAGTGKVLDIAGGSRSNGANLQTWNSNGSAAQRFTLNAVGRADTGEWYYRIVNVNSGKALCAQGGGTAPTTNVWQSGLGNDPAAYWILRRTSTKAKSRYQLVNLKSRLALDVGGGENRNGANVLLYLVCGNNAAQNFTLRRL